MIRMSADDSELQIINPRQELSHSSAQCKKMNFSKWDCMSVNDKLLTKQLTIRPMRLDEGWN